MFKKIIYIAVLLFSLEVSACRCFPNETLQAEFDETEIIANGKVIGKEVLENSDLLKITFEARVIYKGKEIKNDIIIYTPKSNAACGYLEFEVGKEFIVFLSKEKELHYKFEKIKESQGGENIFWTTHCTWTNLYTDDLHSELCELLE